MLAPVAEAFDPSSLPTQKVLRLHVMEGINVLESSMLPRAVAGLLPSSLHIEIHLAGFIKDNKTVKTRVVEAADVCTFDETFEFPMCCMEIDTLVVSLMYSSMVLGESQVAHIALPANNIPVGEFVVPLLNERCEPFAVPPVAVEAEMQGEVGYGALAVRMGFQFI